MKGYGMCKTASGTYCSIHLSYYCPASIGRFGDPKVSKTNKTFALPEFINVVGNHKVTWKFKVTNCATNTMTQERLRGSGKASQGRPPG